jgi:hypothetical protein
VVTLFFFNFSFLFSLKRQQDEDMGRNHHTRTEGTDPGTCIATCSSDVREETKNSVRCFFKDLCRLNKDMGRGAHSKKYLERVRARDLLV